MVAYYGRNQNIVIPNTVKRLPVTRISSRFGDTRGYSSVTIPKNVANIDPGSLRRCRNSIIVSRDNPVYSSINGALFSKDRRTLISVPSNMINDYIIPDYVIAIHEGVFKSGIKRNIIIPSHINIIGADVFTDLLESVTLPYKRI